MQQLKAIATIIRLPNVIFIGLTQWLVYLKIIAPNQHQAPAKYYLLLAISTACIAAAGYIINDYFDIKIDEINKPHRVTVELAFKRRWVMISHILLNIIGLALVWPITKWNGHLTKYWVQLISIFILLIYSAKWKRQAFIGNLSVAFLTSLCVYGVGNYGSQYIIDKGVLQSYLYFYVVFAFFITWVREIIKDLEDIKGDEADNCRTMPIVFGTIFSKRLAVVLMGICMIISLYFLIFTNGINSTFKISYSCLIITPLLFSMYKTLYAIKHDDYKMQSRLIKIITFIGILLMIWI